MQSISGGNESMSVRAVDPVVFDRSEGSLGSRGSSAEYVLQKIVLNTPVANFAVLSWGRRPVALAFSTSSGIKVTLEVYDISSTWAPNGRKEPAKI